MRSVLKIYPQAKWHVYEPVNRDNVLEGAKLAFGQPVETQYKLGECRRNRFARRGFSVCRISRQRALHPRFCQAPQSRCGNMNRLYVVESTPSSTGAKADHRLPMRGAIVKLSRGLCAALGVRMDVRTPPDSAAEQRSSPTSGRRTAKRTRFERRDRR